MLPNLVVKKQFITIFDLVYEKKFLFEFNSETEVHAFFYKEQNYCSDVLANIKLWDIGSKTLGLSKFLWLWPQISQLLSQNRLEV